MPVRIPKTRTPSPVRESQQDSYVSVNPLAAVLRSAADASLLDTYQDERIAAAKQIAAVTDLGFALQARRGALLGLARRNLTRLAPKLMRLGSLRRWAFGVISQLTVQYRSAGSCSGRAGRIAGGDRMPWAGPVRDPDNFAALRGLAWRAQVFGDATLSLRGACSRLNLQVDAFGWNAGAYRAGLVRDAAYLIRPDGYVACASSRQDVLDIEQSLAGFGIKLAA